MYYLLNNGNLFYSEGVVSKNSVRKTFGRLTDYLRSGDLVEMNGKVSQVLEVDNELYVFMNMKVESNEHKIAKVWRLNGRGNYMLKFVREEDEG